MTTIPVCFSPNYGESFFLWLDAQVRSDLRSKAASVLIDVGAYHGDFSKYFLERGLFSGAVLFEPNPRNADIVEEFARTLPNITVERLAVGSASGSVSFFCDDQAATGSVLPYAYAPNGELNQYSVSMSTLDSYLEGKGMEHEIGLLKIDTQGHDLEVLKGAERTLAASEPIVVMEMLFAGLYSGQSAPCDILSWMSAKGYRLAGLFDEHYSAEGWLAWCDACFVPVSRAKQLHEPYQIRTFAPGLLGMPAEAERQLREKVDELEAQNAALIAREAELAKSRAELRKWRNPLRILFR